ncbi:DUF1659 domain-containing protein [Tuberibacillus sp. Marseille-P3662]|uniref:DUF1659 domain-containing protein n=1 Tax=Tuberibacillus sp. Marseille-P3662 TaxID=1965358 RepID=UPI000A1C993F|nr:DUF1659 domain-containing protein [Tuberibacillus sp. Marseille-P3662]
MATSTKVDSRMQLSFDAGVDEKGSPVTKHKSFNNVKISATPDQLYTIATALEPLQTLPLINVERDDTLTIAG